MEYEGNSSMFSLILVSFVAEARPTLVFVNTYALF